MKNEKMPQWAKDVIKAFSFAGFGLLAGVLTVYSVVWIWTFISPEAHFEAGPIGLACKIVAVVTIILWVWIVPEIFLYMIRYRKKGGKQYVALSLYDKKCAELDKLRKERLEYKVMAIHYKTAYEECKRRIDLIDPDSEE